MAVNNQKLTRNILRIAVPSIVNNVTVPLLGLCDVAIMGHVGGAAHIGAITVGSMVFNVVYWLFVFLRMGTSGRTAQARGARQFPLIRQLLTGSIATALMFATAIVVLQWPLRLLAFWLMQATPDVEALATHYYNICIWGAPPMLGLYALTGWFIGMQNTRTPMAIAILQNVVNIAASLILVVGLGLGVKGVALGTLIAQWCAFLLALFLLNHYYGRHLSQYREKPCRTVAKEEKPWKTVAKGKTVSIDIFLRTVCLVAVNLWFTSAGAAQGAEILAANALLMQLFMLFSYIMDGFANAGEALAGRYYGASDSIMLARTVRHLFLWGIAMAVLFTIAYATGGNLFLRLLTTDATVVATAQAFMPWAILIPFAGMAAFVWDGIFIGLTLTRGMLLSCLVAALAFFVITIFLSPSLGNHALWLALITYLALRGIMQTLLYSRALRGNTARREVLTK